MKFQGDILNFCDFIQVFVFTTNHHLNSLECNYTVVSLKQVPNLVTVVRVCREYVPTCLMDSLNAHVLKAGRELYVTPVRCFQ